MATMRADPLTQIRWDDLGSSHAAAVEGRSVTLSGYPVAFPGQTRATRFLLTQEPGCCPGCAPRDPTGTVTVEARTLDFTAPRPCPPVGHLAPREQHAPAPIACRMPSRLIPRDGPASPAAAPWRQAR